MQCSSPTQLQVEAGPQAQECQDTQTHLHTSQQLLCSSGTFRMYMAVRQSCFSVAALTEHGCTSQLLVCSCAHKGWLHIIAAYP